MVLRMSKKKIMGVCMSDDRKLGQRFGGRQDGHEIRNQIISRSSHVL